MCQAGHRDAQGNPLFLSRFKRLKVLANSSGAVVLRSMQNTLHFLVENGCQLFLQFPFDSLRN
jgi:hypothetical protein